MARHKVAPYNLHAAKALLRQIIQDISSHLQITFYWSTYPHGEP